MSYFFKFLHVLFAVGLLSTAIFCFILFLFRKYAEHQALILRLNKMMLILAVLALITGTFLVHPQFTFHTPWIQAAYIFVTLFSLIVLGLIFFRKKIVASGLSVFIYFLLIIILIVIVHDAVTKSIF